MDSEQSLSQEDDAMDAERRRKLLTIYESRLNEIADLAAHVRHELNNSLTGVLGQAQLLLREDLSGTARRRAEKIEELTTRLREAARQLVHIETLRRIEVTDAKTEGNEAARTASASLDRETKN